MYRATCCLCILTASPLIAFDVNEDLIAASRKGDLPAVKTLVEKGAVIETKTPYGQTPLYVAAMNGHEPVVQFLLEKGASTDVKDTFYKAPMLMFVLSRKHYGVAKMLVAKSTASPDENLGAVSNTGNAELIQAVLDKGKPTQRALDRAYEAALDNKQTAVAEALKKAGAQPPPPPVEVDPKVLESYAGDYKSEQLPLAIKVFIKDGKLNAQATGQGAFVTKTKSATVFEFAPAQIVFEFDSPSSFTLKQAGMTFKFKKAVAQ
jgi:hypothetical protein